MARRKKSVPMPEDTAQVLTGPDPVEPEPAVAPTKAFAASVIKSWANDLKKHSKFDKFQKGAK